ncbi:MAG: peptidoglycan editing factor PgeF [Cyanobacteriota bacterium]|nr:peptidoglycan editing factor PgeF [Cyanobacteriota bacterium]
MAEAVEPPFERPDAGFNSLPGWSWVGTYGGFFLQADLLAGFEHGFFTRQWHGREPEELVCQISAGVSVHRPRQIHSSRVLSADAASGEPWPEADGLVSSDGGQSLWVCGADCTPVLIADPASGRVAACHAGWRGVAGRILPEALNQLEAAGSRRGDLLVALGPAISGAAYQVERSVSRQVAASLRPSVSESQVGDGQDGEGLDRTLEACLEELIRSGALLEDGEPDRDRLDIRTATRRQLAHAGIAEERVAICPLCTASEPLLFHSWRRDRVKAVQWSGIVAQG